MEKKQTLKIGEKAANFTLDDQNDNPFTLYDFKRKKILLSFHPLAWTSVCAKQMQSLEKNKKNFDDSNTIAVGISVDSAPSKNAWAKKLGIKNTRLLADFWPHGKVAELYGLFDDTDGVSERANIIIDEDHNIFFIKIYPRHQLPDIQEINRVLE
jgi:peroxiredoxin